jgi:hypothetical protein
MKLALRQEAKIGTKILDNCGHENPAHLLLGPGHGITLTGLEIGIVRSFIRPRAKIEHGWIWEISKN